MRSIPAGFIFALLLAILCVVPPSAHAAELITAVAALPQRLAGSGLTTAAPRAQPVASASCRVGRRGYCFKYQGVCETHAVGKKDCGAWVAACMQCHDAADSCSGHTTKETAQCTRCSTTWSACMERGYQQHWPKPHRYKSG